MLFVAAFILLLALGLYALLGDFICLLIRQARSPLTQLSGPKCPSFFMGNLAEMHDQENNNLISEWERAHGASFVYRGFVGGCRLMTTDPVAVAYILGNAYDYPKPDFVRDSLATMAAGKEGLLTVEGDQHRRQRRILAPAFTAAHIKSLTPVFWEKAGILRDRWAVLADVAVAASVTTTAEAKTKNPFAGCAHVDALAWLGRATLDAIGVAGFGYHFNSLTSENDGHGHGKDELARAFADIFSTARKFRVMTILQVWFPLLRRFRRNSAVMARATATMRRIGMRLIEERSRAVLEEQRSALKDGTAIEGDKTVQGRDLLSVLIRSNLSSASRATMSVEEVLCQISTFIAAGHETTASALTWTLYALVQNPAVQTRLRMRLQALESDLHVTNPDADASEFQRLLTDALLKDEYLESVLREVMRLHAPVTSTMRVCTLDEDAIPVGSADCRDRDGRILSSIRVNKGDIITVPIQAINKSKAIWGEDAWEFRPERWVESEEKSLRVGRRAIPGLWANTLTFLNGNGSAAEGNRACIGWRFALTEMKIMLFVLIRDFEFTMDPSLVIEKKVNVVTRPFVKSQPELGNQMPLYLRRAAR
ncbi:Cytochrome P450 [Mycena chlorophos]|uniref:Cytochrome P450 n=1 Tax=Mycena chlorophos TaxID=658473 RepID=A0A8H6SES4_MYCCL|nr:Cytochrome P450 [Mycena chlorophos]